MVVVRAAFVLVILFGGTVGQPTPPRPNPSESFSSEYERAGLGTLSRVKHLTYPASIYRNYEKGKQIQIQRIGRNDGVVVTLTRGDLKKEYVYFQPYGYCSVKSGEDIKVVRAWDKISEMKYSGLRKFQQRNVHVWARNDTENGIYSEMGVSTEDANELVFIFDDSQTSSSPFGLSVFETFVNSPPLDDKFDIPQMCSNLAN